MVGSRNLLKAKKLQIYLNVIILEITRMLLKIQMLILFIYQFQIQKEKISLS